MLKVCDYTELTQRISPPNRLSQSKKSHLEGGLPRVNPITAANREWQAEWIDAKFRLLNYP